MLYDVFISHASEDKKTIAKPIADRLIALGYSVFLDDYSIKLGESITEKIGNGINSSRYYVVIFSPNFLKKGWPKVELESALTIQITSNRKKILPLLHGLNHNEYINFAPLLQDIKYENTKIGIKTIVGQICDVLGAPANTIEPEPKEITPTISAVTENDLPLRPLTNTSKPSRKRKEIEFTTAVIGLLTAIIVLVTVFANDIFPVFGRLDHTDEPPPAQTFTIADVTTREPALEPNSEPLRMSTLTPTPKATDTPTLRPSPEPTTPPTPKPSPAPSPAPAPVMKDATIEHGILTAYSGPGGDLAVPYGVKYIGDDAFAGCDSLTGITLPDSIIAIGDNAFSECTALTQVALPGSLTTIGYSAFSGCTNLTQIRLPDSLIAIYDAAFFGCSALTQITVPASVTNIGSSAFLLTSLTSIEVDVGNLAYVSTDGILIDQRTNMLHSYPSKREASVYTVPNGITSIGEAAFLDCTALTQVALPGSLTMIGDYAFSGCSNLTQMWLPDSLLIIGSEAFSRCTALAQITITANVVVIGTNVFDGCRNLTIHGKLGSNAERYATKNNIFFVGITEDAPTSLPPSGSS